VGRPLLHGRRSRHRARDDPDPADRPILPIALIVGDLFVDGCRPGFDPVENIDAVELANHEPGRADADLAALISGPVTPTGAVVTGELEKLRAGEPATIRYSAHLETERSRRGPVIVLRNLPPGCGARSVTEAFTERWYRSADIRVEPDKTIRRPPFVVRSADDASSGRHTEIRLTLGADTDLMACDWSTPAARCTSGAIVARSTPEPHPMSSASSSGPRWRASSIGSPTPARWRSIHAAQRSGAADRSTASNPPTSIDGAGSEPMRHLDTSRPPTLQWGRTTAQSTTRTHRRSRMPRPAVRGSERSGQTLRSLESGEIANDGPGAAPTAGQAGQCTDHEVACLIVERWRRKADACSQVVSVDHDLDEAGEHGLVKRKNVAEERNETEGVLSRQPPVEPLKSDLGHLHR
jgi:hypothetical protein